MLWLWLTSDDDDLGSQIYLFLLSFADVKLDAEKQEPFESTGKIVSSFAQLCRFVLDRTSDKFVEIFVFCK